MGSHPSDASCVSSGHTRRTLMMLSVVYTPPVPPTGDDDDERSGARRNPTVSKYASVCAKPTAARMVNDATPTTHRVVRLTRSNVVVVPVAVVVVVPVAVLVAVASSSSSSAVAPPKSRLTSGGFEATDALLVIRVVFVVFLVVVLRRDARSSPPPVAIPDDDDVPFFFVPIAILDARKRATERDVPSSRSLCVRVLRGVVLNEAGGGDAFLSFIALTAGKESLIRQDKGSRAAVLVLLGC